MAIQGIRTDRAGAGFKPQHLAAIIESRAKAGFRVWNGKRPGPS